LNQVKARTPKVAKEKNAEPAVGLSISPFFLQAVAADIFLIVLG